MHPAGFRFGAFLGFNAVATPVCARQATRNSALGFGVNNPFRTYDAFAVFNILTISSLNTSGHERKNKLSSFPDAS
jgi:hypothetical protein